MTSGVQKDIKRYQSLQVDGLPFWQFAGISGSTAVSDVEMILDHSGAAQDYSLIPPTGQIWKVSRMIVFLRDTGQYAAEKYGAGAALTNGVRVYHRNSAGAVIKELTGSPVKENASWSAHCHDVNFFDFGVGDSFLSARWTFRRGGRALTLDGTAGEYLAIRGNDDFTFLQNHSFKCDGYVEA
jgi:hypothetical protein